MTTRPIYNVWALLELPSRRPIDYAAAARDEQPDAGRADASDSEPTPQPRYREPVATVNRQPFRRRHNLGLVGV